MATEFRFPDVGEGIHEGRLVEWLVQEGDTVAVDQPLAKVETDKAVVELPSPAAGRVARLHAKAGDTIRVGEVIATIGGEAAPGPGPGNGQQETGNGQRETGNGGPSAARRPRTPATPHTRALARRLGVDLEAIAGTGREGRVTDEDVERAAAAPAGPAVPAAPAGPAGPAVPAAPAPAPVAARAAAPLAAADGPDEERVPLSHLRRVIAEAMSLSVRTAAHVTHVDEADVTDLVAAQKAARAAGGPALEGLTLLPFFLKAAAVALRDHPRFNATLDLERSEMVLKRRIHLGVAVDTPEGLVVPVVRDVDRKGIEAIGREVADLAGRARERRLALDELRGATCTVTNIGPVGGLFATPIIHQPEVAIVGLHAIKERPWVVDGAVVPRKVMLLSVSFDHRAIDGAEAARFMSDLVRLISNPGLLLARV